MKARQLLAVLRRRPLGYRVLRQEGTSHRVLAADGRANLTFAFHDRDTIPGGMVRRILVKDAGLTPEEAREVLR